MAMAGVAAPGRRASHLSAAGVLLRAALAVWVFALRHPGRRWALGPCGEVRPW